MAYETGTFVRFFRKNYDEPIRFGEIKLYIGTDANTNIDWYNIRMYCSCMGKIIITAALGEFCVLTKEQFQQEREYHLTETCLLKQFSKPKFVNQVTIEEA